MNAPLPPSSTLRQSVWLEPHPALGISLIDHLFNRLDGKYPNVFRANFKSPQSIANWREAWAEMLVEEGVTPDEVKAGISNLRKTCPDYPPTDAQFLEACRPQLKHDIDTLFAIAVEQMMARRNRKPENWPSKRLFWAAQRIGGDLLELTYRQLAGRWAAAWAAAEVDSNKPIPQADPDQFALPAPGKTTLSPTEAKKRAEQIGLHMGKADNTRRWAFDIASDPKRFQAASIEAAIKALRVFGVEISAQLIERAKELGLGDLVANEVAA